MALFGVTPLVLTSGSMSPTIEAGDLALAREVPASDVRPGDVVSTVGSDGVRITHRVVSITADEGGASMVLKGDANVSPDPTPYAVRTVDRVFWDVPAAGHVVAAVGTPLGAFLLGGLAVACLFVAFRPQRRETSGGRHEGGRRRSLEPRNLAMVAGMMALIIPMAHPQQTLALFDDSASLTTGQVASLRVERPATIACTNGADVRILGIATGYFSSVTVAVTHLDTRYDYVARLFDGSGGQLGPDIPMPSGSSAVGSAISTTLTEAQVSVLLQLGSPVTVRVYSRLKNPTSWASTTFRAFRIDTALLGALLLNGIRCGADVSPA